MPDTLVQTARHKWITRTKSVELTDCGRVVYTSVRCERCRAKRTAATEFETCAKANRVDAHSFKH